MDRAAETAAEAVLHLPVAAGTGEREQRLHRRERDADQRERWLHRREREADEREREADEREREADERDRDADERDRDADQRDRDADQREQRLQERAARLRRRAEELRARGDDVRERAEQAIEQANAVLDATRDRARRAGGTINRGYARAARERANVARSARRCARHPVYRQQDFAELADRFSALRKRTAAAAALLAHNEEKIARFHDELASHEPANPVYMRLANDAREAARRAREYERKYGSTAAPRPDA